MYKWILCVVAVGGVTLASANSAQADNWRFSVYGGNYGFSLGSHDHYRGYRDYYSPGCRDRGYYGGRSYYNPGYSRYRDYGSRFDNYYHHFYRHPHGHHH